MIFFRLAQEVGSYFTSKENLLGALQCSEYLRQPTALPLLVCSYSTISNLIQRFFLSFLSSFAFYFLNFSAEWTSRREGLAFRNERARVSSAGLPNLGGNFSCGVQGLACG